MDYSKNFVFFTGFGGTSAFGATNTLGGGGGAFGATGTSAFGAPSGGLFGGVGAQPQAAQQAPLAAAAAGNHINDYLSSLTANPYGDDPLYKNLAPTTEDKLKEVLKPTNSLAQKAVMDPSCFLTALREQEHKLSINNSLALRHLNTAR